jgi:putative transposase
MCQSRIGQYGVHSLVLNLRPPRVIVADKLRSYTAAKKLVLPEVIRRQRRYLNNRVENSHQPVYVRERQM